MGKFVQLISHPSELKAVIQLLYFRKPLHPQDESKQSQASKRCYELLNVTSRSFAAVIQELHPELRDAVMLFYLILRALDTVEDDMSIDPEIKVPLLRTFHDKLNLKDWSFDGNSKTEKDRCVLVEFPCILEEYHKLKEDYQDIIKHITKEMGNGMADYILDENFNVNGVATIKEYDLYCHYVAGLVGEGLTKLMVLADYHEDLEDGRSFWPKEIWEKHTPSLPSFHKDASLESQERGLACINELVLNALCHVKDVLTYLSLVRDPSCFNFCAIPQVMAIATLALVYNNPNVLHGNVKIRKGTTCHLILNSRTLPGVVKIFKHYVQAINHKSSVQDPNYLKIGIKCGEIEQFCELMYPSENAIPKGVVKQKQEINHNILERAGVDDQVAETVNLEETKCNLAVGISLLIVVGAITYFVY
ncbi:uncharacterized protein AC631_04403 [Debaryomyces fabryi]|uniref:Squalene synthase n=1 Tax=Debaryomyces fabryi TaxID=58627 RepID=A0A0V1PUA4_9ASCO|nr:uncharacterized protein AC631_04403 [Debaryomyces fabryi]KRZ99846.1 hypothetical protein AC631_04403 [Debaryomyces fabryi]